MIGFALVSACLVSCSSPTSLSPSAHSPISQQPQQPAKAKISGQILPIGAIATIGSHRVELEVARTHAQQAMGLMYRRFLPENRGMVFPFNPPQTVSFWMKNVVMSLDMVFVSKNTVAAIITAPPCTQDPCATYGPPGAINHVIELRGGRAKTLGLKVGDPVLIQWKEPTKKPSP